jgi:hypothetical protein
VNATALIARNSEGTDGNDVFQAVRARHRRARFALPDFDGRIVALGDFADAKALLVVFWSNPRRLLTVDLGGRRRRRAALKPGRAVASIAILIP